MERILKLLDEAEAMLFAVRMHFMGYAGERVLAFSSTIVLAYSFIFSPIARIAMFGFICAYLFGQVIDRVAKRPRRLQAMSVTR